MITMKKLALSIALLLFLLGGCLCFAASNEIGRDGVYVVYDNGIVRDTSTGLKWVSGPDKDTPWNEARSWVQSLNLDGGGWRMPTIDELSGLYKKGTGDRNMTSLLKTTGWWVWSGEAEGSSKARIFSFYSGRRAWGIRGFSYSGRAFAVSSRKESKNQWVEVASVPQKPSYPQPAPPSNNEIERHGQYVLYSKGVIKDTNTGLEWKAGPDENTNWNEARSWVQSLNLDGGGWRMPTIDELSGLYKKGTGDRNMTSLLKTTGWWVWSGEAEGSSKARIFGFSVGRRSSGILDYSFSSRAFAVRSRNDG